MFVIQRQQIPKVTDMHNMRTDMCLDIDAPAMPHLGALELVVDTMRCCTRMYAHTCVPVCVCVVWHPSTVGCQSSAHRLSEDPAVCATMRRINCARARTLHVYVGSCVRVCVIMWVWGGWGCVIEEGFGCGCTQEDFGVAPNTDCC